MQIIGARYNRLRMMQKIGYRDSIFQVYRKVRNAIIEEILEF
uniref:Uncharacterized protein n=1 Tax=Arundo donax TaxID=35708 RepID=A0A0A9ANY7_ARUDO